MTKQTHNRERKKAELSGLLAPNLLIATQAATLYEARISNGLAGFRPIYVSQPRTRPKMKDPLIYGPASTAIQKQSLGTAQPSATNFGLIFMAF